MKKEEREICKRLWENMQKDSSPWVWSRENFGFVSKIDGLTLVLYSTYDFEGGEYVHFRIEDGDTSKTLSPGFWGGDHLWEMLQFLNKREAAKRNEKQNCVMAKLSSMLA